MYQGNTLQQQPQNGYAEQPQYGYGQQQQQFQSSLPSGRLQQQAYRNQRGFQQQPYQQQQRQQPYEQPHHRSSTPNLRPNKRLRPGEVPPQQQQQLPPQQPPQQQQYYQQQPPQPPQQQYQQEQPLLTWQPQQQQQQQPPQQQRQQQQPWPPESSVSSSPAGNTSVGHPQQQQQQHPVSSNSNPAVAAWLDALQGEILRFTQAVVPNPSEQQHRQATLSAFASIACQALPEHAREMQVALFGSGAAGLALHSSDLDVVVAGLATPDASGGFDDMAKRFVVNCLRRLERSASAGPGRRLLGVSNSRLVARARVPVLKLELACGLELDVSLNDDGGIKAARFLQSFQSDYAALGPLTLLLKCMLKQRGLSEVFMGGLGSWSLVNMVIAHLMEEDKQGEQVDHLGSMVMSFLRRYGVDFDRRRHAVAVKRGGLVGLSDLGASFGRNGILALEDPLTGREVAGGSHRYADVEDIFRRLHQRLTNELADVRQQRQQRGSSGGGSSSGGAHRRFNDESDEWGYDAGNRSPTYKAGIRQQRRSKPADSNYSFDLLELLLDCQEALERPGAAEDADGEALAGAAGGSSRGFGGQGAAGDGRGRGGGEGQQWRWATGVGGRETGQPVYAGQQGSRKRDRWP